MAALLRQKEACTLELTQKGPNTQDKARYPVAVVGHYNEDIMATCHPPGILERLLAHHPAYSWRSDSFG